MGVAGEGLTSCEVHPSGETVCDLTDRGLMKSGVHFIRFPSEWFSVGEAETGSGGDQPVKE
jgi:hypothetical protein